MLTWPRGQPERFAELRAVAAYDSEFALASQSDGAWGAPWQGWVTYPCRVGAPGDGEGVRFRGGDGFAVTTTTCRLYAQEWAC